MASSYGSRIQFGPSLTPVVKALILINVGIFLVYFLFRAFGLPILEQFFALNPQKVRSFWIWQLLTYSFIHFEFFHLLFNMLALWMFGSELENYWSSEVFLKLYLFGCFLGGFLTFLVDFFYPQNIVIGASGGIYALLIAFAMVWPNREILFMLIFPLKAKYFVIIIMLMIAFAQGDRVAFVAHIGGALAGFLFVRYFSFFRNSILTSFSLSRFLQRRRFQKYQKEMELKQNSKEKVDELLDKIHKYGMKSLTRKERKFLNEASKNYYSED